MDKRTEINRREFMIKGFGFGLALPAMVYLPLGCRPENGAGLRGSGLPESTIRRLLAKALERGGDFAEIYCETRQSADITLSEDKVKSLNFRLSQGVGVRVTAGEEVGYAYSDDLAEEQLLKAAESAGMVAAAGGTAGTAGTVKLNRHDFAGNIKVQVPLESIPEKDKVRLLLDANAAARDYDSRITDVNVVYSEASQNFQVANSDGLLVQDEIPLFRLSVSVTAAEGDNRQSGFHSFSRRAGWEAVEADKPRELAGEAARQSISMLDSKEAPTGEMPVILPSGWGGVLFHEAIGHGFEGDFVRKETSVYTDKLGKKVGSPLVTVVDDGTVANMRGSANVDSEGTPTQRTVMIKDGVCEGFLYDLLNARLSGGRSTGNGRRQTFRHIPVPRMTNTFLLPGQASVSDLAHETKKGLLVRQLAGGSVDITTGNFVFNVTEAYMLEEGEITYPVRGASLIGRGAEILERVDMVADDLDFGYGTCGKDGQMVPVCVGQPSLRISRMTVGGTQI
ncbi:TldD/PmbA family protein [candidate division KSB1 bacterium]